LSNPNRKSKAGLTNPLRWKEGYETFYAVGSRVDGRLPKFHTEQQIAEALGSTRQKIHNDCRVALGKFIYRLVKKVGETPDL
jgi:hypothetical protein